MAAMPGTATAGPLHISPSPPGYPLQRVFMQAAVQAGYPQTSDFNGYQQEGAGMYQLTIKDGKRWSTANAYLRPVVGARPNLTVISNAHAGRV